MSFHKNLCTYIVRLPFRQEKKDFFFKFCSIAKLLLYTGDCFRKKFGGLNVYK